MFQQNFVYLQNQRLVPDILNQVVTLNQLDTSA